MASNKNSTLDEKGNFNVLLNYFKVLPDKRKQVVTNAKNNIQNFDLEYELNDPSEMHNQDYYSRPSSDEIDPFSKTTKYIKDGDFLAYLDNGQEYYNKERENLKVVMRRDIKPNEAPQIFEITPNKYRIIPMYGGDFHYLYAFPGTKQTDKVSPYIQMDVPINGIFNKSNVDVSQIYGEFIVEFYGAIIEHDKKNFNSIYVGYDATFSDYVVREKDDQVTFNGADLTIPKAPKGVLKPNTRWDRFQILKHGDMYYSIQRIKRVIYPHLAIIEHKIPDSNYSYKTQVAIYNTDNSQIDVHFRCFRGTFTTDWCKSEFLAFLMFLKMNKDDFSRTKDFSISQNFTSAFNNPPIQKILKRYWSSLIYNPNNLEKFVIERTSFPAGPHGIPHTPRNPISTKSTFVNYTVYTNFFPKLAKFYRLSGELTSYETEKDPTIKLSVNLSPNKFYTSSKTSNGTAKYTLTGINSSEKEIKFTHSAVEAPLLEKLNLKEFATLSAFSILDEEDEVEHDGDALDFLNDSWLNDNNEVLGDPVPQNNVPVSQDDVHYENTFMPGLDDDNYDAEYNIFGSKKSNEESSSPPEVEDERKKVKLAKPPFVDLGDVILDNYSVKRFQLYESTFIYFRNEQNFVRIFLDENSNKFDEIGYMNVPIYKQYEYEDYGIDAQSEEENKYKRCMLMRNDKFFTVAEKQVPDVVIDNKCTVNMTVDSLDIFDVSLLIAYDGTKWNLLKTFGEESSLIMNLGGATLDELNTFF